jgi:hypothetical protein
MLRVLRTKISSSISYMITEAHIAITPRELNLT